MARMGFRTIRATQGVSRGESGSSPYLGLVFRLAGNFVAVPHGPAIVAGLATELKLGRANRELDDAAAHDVQLLDRQVTHSIAHNSLLSFAGGTIPPARVS